MGMRPRHAIQRAVAVVVIAASALTYQSNAEKDVKKVLLPGERILWRDPGDVASLDLRYGVGGKEHQPRPPFQFVDEDNSGTTAKINVVDSRGAKWNIKWGNEVLPSAFCSRLAWALGYVAEPEYYVAQGRI